MLTTAQNPIVATPSIPETSATTTPSITETDPIAESINTLDKEVISQQDRIIVKEEAIALNSKSSNKTEPNGSKSGRNGIVFAVIGFVIVGSGVFFFMSAKQTSNQVPVPMSTTAPSKDPATVAPPEVQTGASEPVVPKVAPIEPSPPVASVPSVVTRKPAPKPASSPAPSVATVKPTTTAPVAAAIPPKPAQESPSPAPASNAPDINKIMRDAANK